MRARSVIPCLFFGASLCACDPPVRTAPDAPSGASSATTPATGSAGAQASQAPVSRPDAPPKVDPPAAEALTKMARASNQFGFDLYRASATEPGNFVMSPASLSTALAMTWGGAKAATAEQMKKTLHMEQSPKEVMDTSGRLASMLQDPSRPIKFRIANRLFGEKTYSFEASFLDATKAAYGAPLEPLDFKTGHEAARARINGWVEGQTEKRIKDLIPPRGINDQTRLVLVNAIYFLGDWQDPFEKDHTKPASFSTSATAKKDVPFMNQAESFGFVEKDGVKAVALPYKGGSMSMLFVLPDKVDGLPELEKSLDAAKLDALVKSLEQQRVLVSIPKFKIDPPKTLEMGPALKKLGMVLPFDRDKADFTGIANPPSPADRLYVSEVFHKAFVLVDEKGTEAAAATAVPMARAGAAPSKPAEFKADHPFLFFIRDEASGMILFMGRVADPA
jgi:serpin B